MLGPSGRLEGAPVPAARNAGGNVAGLAQRSSESFLRVLILQRIEGLGRSLFDRSLDGFVLGVDLALDLGQALRARFLPTLVGNVAEIASTRLDALGMEASILVERNVVRGVRRAEDVTTVAAVMTAQEEAERRAASRRVAVGRRRVRL